jgi:prophage regulatory protein
MLRRNFRANRGISRKVGIRRSTIYKYVGEGKFPAPIKVGEKSVRWKLSEVLAWRVKVSA